jgi:hypothetical protein
MATFNEALYDILLTDGQSAASGSLGDLLEYNAVTKPRTVYYMNGPDRPDLPILTYSIVAQSSYFPKSILYGFTAWGNNFEAILKRVFDLLHKRLEITATDYSVKGFLADNAGPDLWDEDLKSYYRQDTFRAIVVRTPYPGNTGSNN